MSRNFKGLALVCAAAAVAATGSTAEARGHEASTQAKAAMRAQVMQRLLAKFDANHNGKLDPEERAAAQAALQGHDGGDAAGPLAGGDKEGDKAANRAELGKKLKEEMLKKFDANGNGKLDPEEREAARKAMQAHLKDK
jgi:hypothetical protein